MQKFERGLFKFFNLIFGINPRCFRMSGSICSKNNSRYALQKLQLQLQINGHSINLKIDLTFTKSRSHASFYPVTYGSCLQFKNGMVEFRDIPSAKNLTHWSITDVITLLSEGSDKKLPAKMHSSNMAYQLYYWIRIQALEKTQVHLIEGDDREPKRPKQSEIDRCISDMGALDI